MKRADVLEEKEFQAMIRYTLEHGQTRNAVLIALGGALGLRVGDLLELKWRDILAPNGEVREWIEVRERKNRAVRVVRAPKWLRPIIATYLSTMGEPPDPNDRIFRLSRQRTWQILKTVADACGVQKRISAHSLRKYYCTTVYNLTRDPVLACQFTGHKNPAQLLRYIGYCGPTIERIWAEYANKDLDFNAGLCKGGGENAGNAG